MDTTRLVSSHWPETSLPTGTAAGPSSGSSFGDRRLVFDHLRADDTRAAGGEAAGGGVGKVTDAATGAGSRSATATVSGVGDGVGVADGGGADGRSGRRRPGARAGGRRGSRSAARGRGARLRLPSPPRVSAMTSPTSEQERDQRRGDDPPRPFEASAMRSPKSGCGGSGTRIVRSTCGTGARGGAARAGRGGGGAGETDAGAPRRSTSDWSVARNSPIVGRAAGSGSVAAATASRSAWGNAGGQLEPRLLQLAHADRGGGGGGREAGVHRVRARAGERLVQQQPEGVHVDAAGIRHHAAEDLRRQVGEGAHLAGVGHGLARGAGGDAEVDQARRPVVAEDDVRRLQVAVEDAGLVGVVEGGGEGNEGAQGLGQRHRRRGPAAPSASRRSPAP